MGDLIYYYFFRNRTHTHRKVREVHPTWNRVGAENAREGGASSLGTNQHVVCLADLNNACAQTTSASETEITAVQVCDQAKHAETNYGKLISNY